MKAKKSFCGENCGAEALLQNPRFVCSLTMIGGVPGITYLCKADGEVTCTDKPNPGIIPWITVKIKVEAKACFGCYGKDSDVEDPPRSICGNGIAEHPEEECDGADNSRCKGMCAPGLCLDDCTCIDGLAGEAEKQDCPSEDKSSAGQ